MDFRNQAQALTALMRYNDSMPFAQNVLGWAAAYATGTAPLNLPPIYGPVPVLGPYLPGIWGLSQATLVSSTQAGYLLPGAGAAAPSSVLLEQAPPPPPVVVPEPPTWVAPAAAASVPAPVSAADARGAAVAPQLALQGDGPRTEPTQSYSAPAYTEPDPVSDPAPDLVSDPVPDPVSDSVPDPMPDPVSDLGPDPVPDPMPDLGPDPVSDLGPDLVSDPAPEAPAQAAAAGNGGSRQSGRAQIDSAPKAPSQSSGTGDSDGGKSAGRERRGSRGN
jgi:hypothetical protein